MRGRGGDQAGPGRHLFHPLPEDRGPLRPGEEAELLAFVQERWPRFYDLLQQLKERDPELLRRKLEENAPHLRHMRRVFALSPEIGQIMRSHAENMYRIRRLAGSLRDEPADSPVYVSTLQSIRERLGENVQLEINALETLRAALQENHAQRVENRLAELLEPGADLAAVPEQLRTAIEAYHAATDEVARAEAQKRVRGTVTSYVESELEAMAQRASDLRESAPEEVDQRLERILEGVKRHRGRERPHHRRDEP